MAITPLARSYNNNTINNNNYYYTLPIIIRYVIIVFKRYKYLYRAEISLPRIYVYIRYIIRCTLPALIAKSAHSTAAFDQILLLLPNRFLIKLINCSAARHVYARFMKLVLKLTPCRTLPWV